MFTAASRCEGSETSSKRKMVFPAGKRGLFPAPSYFFTLRIGFLRPAYSLPFHAKSVGTSPTSGTTLTRMSCGAPNSTYQVSCSPRVMHLGRALTEMRLLQTRSVSSGFGKDLRNGLEVFYSDFQAFSMGMSTLEPLVHKVGPHVVAKPTKTVPVHWHT